MPMQKGDTILRSALIAGLQLELTYRDPSVPERSNELRKPNQKRAKAGLSTVLLDTTHGEVRERQHGLSLRDRPDFDPDWSGGKSCTRVGVRLGRILLSRRTGVAQFDVDTPQR
jgi:hypothetical protein